MNSTNPPLPSRFDVGYPCFLKRGSIPVIILQETRGQLRWLVEFGDEESGEPKGIEQEVTSQQLQKSKETDDHPTLRRADSSSKSSLGVHDIRQEQDEANRSSAQVQLDESDDAIDTSLTGCWQFQAGSMIQSQLKSKIQRMDVPSSGDVSYVEWTHAHSEGMGVAGVDLRRTRARCTTDLGFLIQTWVPKRMLNFRGSTRATI
jgi:hypothetical protein